MSDEREWDTDGPDEITGWKQISGGEIGFRLFDSIDTTTQWEYGKEEIEENESFFRRLCEVNIKKNQSQETTPGNNESTNVRQLVKRRRSTTTEEDYQTERRINEAQENMVFDNIGFRDQGVVVKRTNFIRDIQQGDLLCDEIMGKTSEEMALEAYDVLRANMGGIGKPVDLSIAVGIFKKSFSFFRRKLVHSIIDKESSKGFEEMHASFNKTCTRRNLFIAFYHEQGERSHWHVIHDCDWRNYTCQCLTFNVRPRTKRKCQSTTSADASSFIAALLKYSIQGGRKLYIVQIGKSKWESYDRNESLQVFGDTGGPVSGKIQEIDNFCEDGNERSGSIVSNMSNSIEKTHDIYGEVWKSSKVLPNELSKFILTNITYPIEQVMQSHAWRRSIYQFVLHSDKTFQRGMQHARNILTQYNFNQYNQLYKNAENIYMGAIDSRSEDFYYSPEESVKIALKLLKHQFKSEAESIGVSIHNYIGAFIKQLWDVFEKKIINDYVPP